MNFVVVEAETLEKLIGEIQDLKQTVASIAQLGKLPGGENEWEYYKLEEVLELLGVKKKSWYKTYKNTVPRVIPYTQYGDKVWVKKTDLKKFLEKRRQS